MHSIYENGIYEKGIYAKGIYENARQVPVKYSQIM